MLDKLIFEKKVFLSPKNEKHISQKKTAISPLSYDCGGKGKFFIPRKATDEVLDEISPEEIAMK